MTFLSDAPLAALVPIWEKALMGLTGAEIAMGVNIALQMYKSEYMPPPAMVRGWSKGWAGSKAEEPPRPGGQKLDASLWEVATKPDYHRGGTVTLGRGKEEKTIHFAPMAGEVYYHPHIKDAQRDPALTWQKLFSGSPQKEVSRSPRGIPVEQMLDPCPECQNGTGVVDFRNGPPKGPRLAIKCRSCGWITARGLKMREAINLWNR